MNPTTTELINTTLDALGPVVTATDLESYLLGLFSFNYDNKTREFLSDLFENPEEMFCLERFVNIFARFGVETEVRLTTDPAWFGERRNKIVATFQGVKYELSYYNDYSKQIQKNKRPSKDGLPPKYGLTLCMNFGNPCLPVNHGERSIFTSIEEGLIRINHRECMSFKSLLGTENLHNLDMYTIYVDDGDRYRLPTPFFGSERLGSINIDAVNIRTREQAVEAARNSAVYTLFKLIYR